MRLSKEGMGTEEGETQLSWQSSQQFLLWIEMEKWDDWESKYDLGRVKNGDMRHNQINTISSIVESSVQFSLSVMSNSLQPHGLQHRRKKGIKEVDFLVRWGQQDVEREEEVDWLWARSIFSRTERKKEQTAIELKPCGWEDEGVRISWLHLCEWSVGGEAISWN